MERRAQRGTDTKQKAERGQDDPVTAETRAGGGARRADNHVADSIAELLADVQRICKIMGPRIHFLIVSSLTRTSPPFGTSGLPSRMPTAIFRPYLPIWSGCCSMVAARSPDASALLTSGMLS